MRKQTIFVLFLCLVAVGALAAQSVSVDYVDGAVQQKVGASWVALQIGDELASGASIRLQSGGLVELSKGNQRISVVKEGTYLLSDLLKSTGPSAKPGATGFALVQKIKTIATAHEGQGTAGGVRGADQSAAASVPWAEESEEARDNAASLLSAGKCEEAAKVLTSAMGDAPPEAKPEMQYMLAQAYYGQKETARAFRAITSVTPGVTDSFYPDYMILKAQVLLDSSAYGDAQDAVQQFLKSKPQSEYAQAAYLIAAQCAKAVGDAAALQAAVKSGVALAPQSETAQILADTAK